MKYRIIQLALLLCAILSITSCSYRRLAYLQDMEVGVDYPVAQKHETTIRSGDKLDIVVTANSPALAAPFNLSKGSSAFDSMTGEIQYNAGEEEVSEYLVGENGAINFPVLGELYVEGMTPTELKAYIEGLIVAREYIREPVVKVAISNFKITLLGETTSGIVDITTPSVNIFELIAMAHDLNLTAKRNDIWVIRTENGVRTTYSINPQSKSCYDSPVFYLQQNDMVYVKPRRSKSDSNVESIWRMVTFGMSAISTISTVLLWASSFGSK